jgi:hypothetical protein
MLMKLIVLGAVALLLGLLVWLAIALRQRHKRRRSRARRNGDYAGRRAQWRDHIGAK